MASGPHSTATAAAAASSAAPSAGGSSSGTTTTTTTTTGGILIGDRLYSEVSLTIDHSLIPEERLSPTPSMQDGLDLPSETDLRILGCELIQAAGILLRLPQVSALALGRLGAPLLPSVPYAASQYHRALGGWGRLPQALPFGAQPGPGCAGAGGCGGGGRTWQRAVRGGGGRGKGSDRRHKMAAAPGAGPPDPCASVLLSCLQVAMATGQVLFHRFFYSKSFVKHSFEVSTAEAGKRDFFIRKWVEVGVVLAASFSRKGVV